MNKKGFYRGKGEKQYYGATKSRHRRPDGTSSNTNANTEQRNKEIEEALASQREKAKTENQVKASATVCNKAIIPGFEYDPETDRYYPSSKRASTGAPPKRQKSEQQHIPRPEERNNHLLLNKSVVHSSSSCISSLFARERSAQNRRSYNNDQLYRLYALPKTTSHVIRPIFSPTIAQRDPLKSTASESCVSVHPQYGLLRGGLDSRMICVYKQRRISRTRRNDIQSFHQDDIEFMHNSVFPRFMNQSNPSNRVDFGVRSLDWCPFVQGTNSSGHCNPLFAAVLETDAESVIVIMKTRQLFSNSAVNTDWETHTVAYKKKANHRPQKVLWDRNDVSKLYYTTQEEIRMSFLPHSSQAFSSSSSSSALPSSTTTIFTTRTEHTPVHHTVTQPVTLCCPTQSFAGANNLIISGMRNGTIIPVDTRVSSQSLSSPSVIGKMNYCIDHLACMRDGFSVIAMDITGNISIFDARMTPKKSNSSNSKKRDKYSSSSGANYYNNSNNASDSFGSYMNIVDYYCGGRTTGIAASTSSGAGALGPSISTGRCFWIDPDNESFVITAAKKSQIANVNKAYYNEYSHLLGRFSSSPSSSPSSENMNGSIPVSVCDTQRHNQYGVNEYTQRSELHRCGWWTAPPSDTNSPVSHHQNRSSSSSSSSSVHASRSDLVLSTLSLVSWSLSRGGGPSSTDLKTSYNPDTWRLLACHDIVHPSLITTSAATTAASGLNHRLNDRMDSYYIRDAPATIRVDNVLIAPNNNISEDINFRGCSGTDRNMGMDDFFFIASSSMRDSASGSEGCLYMAKVPS